ncbi:MAG: (2Fe-2S)-binding protein [Nitrospirota bacterium]|jgi:bacterioferritin-associated ferredoxin
MIVCLCGGVSDREIRDAIDRSGGDVAAILAATGAGQECGECQEDVEWHCRRSGHGRCSTSQMACTERRA